MQAGRGREPEPGAGSYEQRPERLALDHLVLAVDDLDQGAARLLAATGLRAVAGGAHAGLGTANALVPLAHGSYLELVAVTDPAAAAGNPWGRAMLAAAGPGLHPLLWCVRSEDLDASAQRLGLPEPEPWTRSRPDGTQLRWRLAGLAAALAEPALPFLIGWAVPPALHPAAAGDPAHRLAGLQISGDPARVRRWIGAAPLPVEVRAGRPGLAAVLLSVDGSDVRLPAAA